MHVRRVAAVVALAGLGFIGLNNAQSWPAAQTGAQRLAAAVAVASGFLALASAGALWWRGPALRALLLATGVAVTAAAGLAPWAWGGAPAGTWLSAAAAGALLAAAVGWLAWTARAP